MSNSEISSQIDCCIIWHPGLKHASEILDKFFLRPGIEILYIYRLRSFKLRKFLHAAYSQDWLPAAHVSAKTIYLRTHPRDALVIFYMSLRPNLIKSVSYNSPFLECQDNRVFKEQIRELYNPRDAFGRVSLNHVIHITDNQHQSESIFSFIHPDQTISSIVPSDYCVHSVPRGLHTSSKARLELIPINQFVCQTLRGSMWSSYLHLSQIESSPHFKSVSNGDVPLYKQYVESHLGVGLRGYYSWTKYQSLISLFDISSGHYPKALHPVIVHGTKSGKYLIVDGLHRASLSLVNSIDYVPALVMER
jgi:hypothetical protein